MKKLSKEEKKLQKTIRKMKPGDEIRLHDFDIICHDDQFYLMIHPCLGIFEKAYAEIDEWIVEGGDLE